MKTVALMAVLCPAIGAGAAQAASCKAEARDKKLAGAALTGFMKKRETDAKKACDGEAVERKLAGAAKTSFTKKCAADRVGS